VPLPRLLPVLVVLLSLAFAGLGCGSDGGETTTAASATAAAATDATTATATCRDVAAPGAKQIHERAPKQPLERGADYTVTLQTSCGDIPILLDQAAQPKTAASFAHLVRDGFYDGLSFHRVVPGFVVQGGDPAGDGTGGPGYSVREKPPADARYTRGVVAMAKSQIEPAGTSGSQFFIVPGEDAGLPPDYAVVGKVVGDGMQTVDRIEAIPAGAQDRPQQPVVIKKATISAG
jgi:cyclophilin family peptidyl-prolyl cis-trans isomerase